MAGSSERPFAWLRRVGLLRLVKVAPLSEEVTKNISEFEEFTSLLRFT